MLLLCSQCLLFAWTQGSLPRACFLISDLFRETEAYVSGGYVLQPAEGSTRPGQAVCCEVEHAGGTAQRTNPPLRQNQSSAGPGGNAPADLLPRTDKRQKQSLYS